MHHAFVAERIGCVGDDVFQIYVQCREMYCVVRVKWNYRCAVYCRIYRELVYVAEYGVSKPFRHHDVGCVEIGACCFGG